MNFFFFIKTVQNEFMLVFIFHLFFEKMSPSTGFCLWLFLLCRQGVIHFYISKYYYTIESCVQEGTTYLATFCTKRKIGLGKLSLHINQSRIASYFDVHLGLLLLSLIISIIRLLQYFWLHFCLGKRSNLKVTKARCCLEILAPNNS